MQNYLELGKKILNEGMPITSRNGKIKALFGEQLKFDLAKGFPLLTTKRINFDHIKHETLWYLKGTDKITYLKENNVNIWNLWADENDSIGPTYGVQWRNFNSENKDQIREAINDIINTPQSRRIIVTGWNPLQLQDMKLPPCLVLIQFHVDDNERLHTTVYQRSADFCLGVPYDIAEMALLTELIATQTKLKVGTLTMQYGNIHIYQNHGEIFKEIQATRNPRMLPILTIDDNLFFDIDNVTADNIHLHHYNPDEKIKYEISK